ncbi:hypothetical protein [Sphingobacterium hungaricum]|uniref:Uncharacterized protein n=1 Tax=Sphingobacterium hungaricum TaxID=2082723 RepID=A0A928YTW3_9SPHI|nr:hypothetical protein [Sphingobacterium hungaricum]MBE8715528.1 hypothetical protein [Sphingobacterium hungaricum]
MQIIFLVLTFLSLLLIYWGTGSNKRVLIVLSFWQLIIGTLSFLTVFEENPTMFPFFLISTALITFLLLKGLKREKLNTNALLFVHVLRIPVEFVLLQLSFQGKIPTLMTFQGFNFDILIGLSALIIMGYQQILKRKISPKFLVAWNIAGIVFLLIIVSLAILSSPLPIQLLAFSQPNVALLEFPYSFLPTCIVPIVFMSHFLLIKQSKKENVSF